VLKLSKDDRKNLRQALTSSFPSYPTLKIFVSDNFDLRLNEIATSTATAIAADDLIEHFEAGSQDGDIADLILALQQERPRNPDVQKLMGRLQGFLQQRWVLDPSSAIGPATGPAAGLSFELPHAYDDAQLEAFLPQPLSYEADLGKLQRGLRLANAVCRVAFTDRATTGTGVLVAPDLILTNYHLLSQQALADPIQLAEAAKALVCEFGFVSEEHNTPVKPDTFAIDSSQPVVSWSPPSELDYVLLRVEPQIATASHIKPLLLGSTVPLPSPKAGLNLLQHSEGNLMQVSLSASGVVSVDLARHRVWYVNRTQGGSSGSPCFNDDWQMVALHHLSMSRGFGAVREGILLSAILAKIAEFLG
jgi:endonuclease G, mitochondrial